MPALVSFALGALSTGLDAVDIYDRFAAICAKRRRQAILAEIKDGVHPIVAASDDDLVEIIALFQQASASGAAVINLRLMLRILKGFGKLERPVYASDFARLKRLVENLSREEVIFLTILHRNYLKRATNPPDGVSIGPVWDDTANELVPSIFPTEDMMRAIAYGAQRTGLLFAENSVDASGYLTPSPLMAELAEFAELDESLWQSEFAS